MAMFGFPHWQLKSTSTESGVVAPDERLPFAQTAVMGVQHAVAMFGATVLMPILMGLDPNLSILMSGIGTLLFFFITGGRVPSYLGSSAAFVGVVIAATGFNGQAMMLIAPVAVILVAENLGHLKAVAGMTGRNMDPYMGRAFVGDGLATMLSGSVGGSGVTTYAENIGVMAVTKVYSTLVFVAAAVIAMLLGFSPKFGALIHTIPAAVIGGASIVVFGLIAVAGARIWVQNSVDLSQNGNLIMVAVTLVLGAGDFALTLGGFTLGGIGTATFGAILLNALLSRRLVDVPPPEVVHQKP
ncbi:TPA: solute carrier family 23 protein [Escherichia coli]